MRKRRSKFIINLRILFDVLAVILIWRGVWMILDYYLFPDFPFLSAALSFAVGLIVLLLDDQLLEEIKH